MDPVRNEEMQRKIGDMRVDWLSRAGCVEVVWTHVENGRGPVGEKNSRIRCERCEVERKTMSGMDGRCEKSVG